jgi:hypothetical protein
MHTTPNLRLKTHPPRLKLLQEHDPQRPWLNLQDRRTCILCGAEFSGESIRISVRLGKAMFACPSAGCRGNLKHFVRPGNPLLEEDLWEQWMTCSIPSFASLEDEESLEAEPPAQSPEPAELRPSRCRQALR